MRYDFCGECDFCGAHGPQVLAFRGEMSTCADRGACADRQADAYEQVSPVSPEHGRAMLEAAASLRAQAVAWRRRRGR